MPDILEQARDAAIEAMRASDGFSVPTSPQILLTAFEGAGLSIVPVSPRDRRRVPADFCAHGYSMSRTCPGCATLKPEPR
jgi:hypothetical protein